MPKYAVILPAAGRSSRFGGKEKKPYAILDGRAVWLRTAEMFVTRDEVAQTLLVLTPDDMETFREKFTANIAFMNVKLVPGGAHRFESVANAGSKKWQPTWISWPCMTPCGPARRQRSSIRSLPRCSSTGR